MYHCDNICMWTKVHGGAKERREIMYKIYVKDSWNQFTHEHYKNDHETRFFDNRKQAMEYLLNLERENKGFLDYDGTEIYSNTDFYTLLLGSNCITYALTYVD